MANWRGADAWHLVALDENGVHRPLISFAREAEAQALADRLTAHEATLNV